MHARELLNLQDKIKALSEERQNEVIDFVEFLSRRDETHYLNKVARQVSEPAFSKIWDNAEDDIYDQL